MDLPLYGPARRTRGGSNSSNSSSSSHVAYCLVDGCNSDLSKCRDYHRRHKVCEVHSKTPKVTIRGQEQRFCQQCSRFHSLIEFDDAKRSCRKRLDGHNRRRRKSQPEPTVLLSPTQLLSDFQDAAKYFQPAGAQVYPTSSTASCSWLGAVKPRNSEDYFSSSRHEMSLNFSDRKEQIQFPFLQGTQQQERPLVLRAPCNISSTSAHGEGCGQELFLGTVSPQSNRALSLLSHTEASSPGKGINLFSTSQPLHHHRPPNHYESSPGVLVSQGGMFFQIRHDASSSSLHLDHRTSPSSWEE